jgi:hypothetical protein
MSEKKADVPIVSPASGIDRRALVDSEELASRLRVPESWIRNRTRERTPKDERIPCIRLGRYVRFDLDSSLLRQWLEKHQQ